MIVVEKKKDPMVKELLVKAVEQAHDYLIKNNKRPWKYRNNVLQPLGSKKEDLEKRRINIQEDVDELCKLIKEFAPGPSNYRNDELDRFEFIGSDYDDYEKPTIMHKWGKVRLIAIECTSFIVDFESKPYDSQHLLKILDIDSTNKYASILDYRTLDKDDRKRFESLSDSVIDVMKFQKDGKIVTQEDFDNYTNKLDGIAYKYGAFRENLNMLRKWTKVKDKNLYNSRIAIVIDIEPDYLTGRFDYKIHIANAPSSIKLFPPTNMMLLYDSKTKVKNYRTLKNVCSISGDKKLYHGPKYIYANDNNYDNYFYVGVQSGDALSRPLLVKTKSSLLFNKDKYRLMIF